MEIACMTNPTRPLATPTFQFSDGGRTAAGFRGKAGDCATRAIAIATGLSYQQAYDLVNEFSAQEASGRGRRKGKSSAAKGVHAVTMQKIMAHLGWTWTATMGIGTGCTVHVNAKELPAGRLILRLSRHYAAFIDGVLIDNHDSARDGKRGVYGFWSKR